MLKYFHTNSKNDCFGCKACEQICGEKAITFNVDNEGFAYPNLDLQKCVNCGICEKVCPIEQQNSVLNAEGNVYAAQNRNSELLKKSSSGGLFSIIASYILNNGGVVYGASYNDNMYVEQKRIDNMDALPSLMGSKYVQSDTKNTFRQVREDLRQGKMVYYTGTPCMIAGLRLFLMKDYPNLITSDLICHGTPSNQLFLKIVSEIENRFGGRIYDYSFRDKKVGGWSCCSSSSHIKKGTKNKYLKYSREMQAYFNAFISGSLMRISCYSCPFAITERVGDITLADFWGARKKTPDFPNLSNGVSLVLLNSTKGRQILERIKKELTIEPIPMDWAVSTNHNLTNPTPLTSKRTNSYDKAFSNFSEFVNEYCGDQNESLMRTKFELLYFIRTHNCILRLVSKTKKLIRKLK